MLDPTETQHFEHINNLFISALKIPAAERECFLSQACAGDEAVLRSALRLLRDFDQLSNFLERPAHAVARLSDQNAIAGDQLLCGRFRVVRLLGRGGMGEVYHAQDLALGEPVALKTLRLSLSENERFVARFREEIRAARKISHPNVCRIHDLFEHAPEGLLFFTMELLVGQTLADYLKNTARLDPSEAQPLILQMAAGLQAIHNAGITHRDFKPGNIMLVPQGSDQRVVITDFGLASLVPQSGAQSPTLTRPGEILGSMRFMAPEQWLCEQISLRTDLFSLGLVIYEMMTGRHPYPDEEPIQTAVRRITRDPPAPVELAPSLPRAWNDAILWCLSRNPEERPPGAGHLVEALADPNFRLPERRRLETTPVLPLDDGRAQGWKRLWGRLPQRWLLGALAAILVAVVLLEFSSLASRVRPKLCRQWPGTRLFCELPTDKDIAVLPFRVSGTSDADRALASGLARHLREAFHRLAPDPDKMCVHLRTDQLSEGVRLALEGEVEAAGGALTLRLRIRESRAADGQSAPLTLRRVERTWSQGSVGDLYERPLVDLAEALEIHYPRQEWQAWSQGAPKHTESVISYFEGLGYLEAGRFEDAANVFNAVIDPTRSFGFAAAHVGLGDAYRFLFNQSRDSGWELRARGAYLRALPLDRDFGFAGAEKSLADLDAVVGDTASAVEHYAAALRLWPYDHPLQRRLVATYESADRLDDAIAVLRKAAGLTPQCWLTHNALASLYSRHARWREAETSFLELIRLAPDNATAFRNLAFDYIKMGRFDDAIEMASKSLLARASPLGYSTLGRAYLYRGCAVDALVNLRKAVELEPDFFVVWANLADALHGLEPGSQAAASASARTLELCRRALDKTPTDTLAGARYALDLARLGRKNEALDHVRRLLAQGAGSSDVSLTVAEALEQAGQRSEALQLIERALRSGFALPQVESNRGLSGLRQDAKYGNLLARLRLNPNADPGGLSLPRETGCPEWGVPGKGWTTK